MIRRRIMASEIMEGMEIFVQGHLMLVSEVNHITYGKGNESPCKTGTYFKATCVNKNDNIFNTGYNGARYGSIDTHLWTIQITIDDDICKEA